MKHNRNDEKFARTVAKCFAKRVVACIREPATTAARAVSVFEPVTDFVQIRGITSQTNHLVVGTGDSHPRYSSPHLAVMEHVVNRDGLRCVVA